MDAFARAYLTIKEFWKIPADEIRIELPEPRATILTQFLFEAATLTSVGEREARQVFGRRDTRREDQALGTDGTKLNNYNWKVTWSPSQHNRFSFQNTWAEKFKNARDASDTRPIETTFRQRAVSSDYGKFGWEVGPSPLWKASDQHIISDRWLIDFQWAHLGNNFVLDFHDGTRLKASRMRLVSFKVEAVAGDASAVGEGAMAVHLVHRYLATV